MTKRSFIELLTTMSKEDIDRWIKEKGKPRKPIKVFIHLDELEGNKVTDNTDNHNI